MEILYFLQTHPSALLLVSGLFGLAMGSFLNVVILRLPAILQRQWREQCHQLLGLPAEASAEALTLSKPRSRCPRCGHGIRVWENIPVLSYLLLRGRCSQCDQRISPRYPLVEALTAVLSVIAAARFGATWQLAAALVLTWGLVALSFIDYDTQLLPDLITLPLLWLGLLVSLGHLFTDPVSSIVGAVAGYLSLWGLYHGFKRLTGKEGMGYGDFKLFALFGAWLGWQGLLPVILLSSIVGASLGITLILVRGRERNLPMPFGPYLAAAGWISLIWGGELQRAYELYLRWAGIG